MAETVKMEEQFAILSEEQRSSTPERALKAGDTFAVFDPHGDIVPATEHGLYHNGTRFLSRFELLLGNRPPLLLSSTISEDNTIFTADLTNPDVIRDNCMVLGRGVLHLFRSRVLTAGGWTECLRLANHGLHPIEAQLTFRYDADFADIFEVRGTRRPARGQLLSAGVSADPVLRYRGLDGVERQTRIHPSRSPDRTGDRTMSFCLSLEPHASIEIEVALTCEVGNEARPARRYSETVAERRREINASNERACRIVSSNQAFNRWIQRSSSDLRMLTTDTSYGPYPYAGIPWFSTPFGRDGIVTALQLLWASPDIARGVLAFLANTQASTLNDAQDAQPGKILHEMRDGEMAALGEIPFGRYYGSVDATPLFVALAHAYFERTGDLPFVDGLWPHVLAALDWMQRYGDADRDGFIEYTRRSKSGLVQQGWKDSWDSVFHADGTMAELPVALCEVQGYAYAAWSGAAKLAAARGDEVQASEWRRRADDLQSHFEQAFWCEAIGTYALALDGRKQQCQVRTSNAGHCLFASIANRVHAKRTADTLMSEASFGGWGVRTVSSGAARYNPMSYHNGSVWPHDNSLVAAGLARYGFMTAAARVFNAMFDLSQTVDLQRLPELICGFHRRSGDSPTLYPVACAPQAWSAGAVYLLLQACLGLQVDALAERVSFTRAVLPAEIDWLRVINLSVGAATVDLLLTRHDYGVGVTVLRREGDVEIVSVN